MSKPAVRSRKPKPEAMFCRAAGWSSVLVTRTSRQQATSATTSDDLEDRLAHLGPIEEARRRGRACRSAALGRRRPSLELRRAARRAKRRPPGRRRARRRQRIGGAYCRPPLVHSSFRPRAILSREPGADVALEDLAVVADRLDDAVRPSRCRGRCPCRSRPRCRAGA